jgi:N-acetylglutamate synthase-like GNAT family acetyltransferase
MRCAIQDVMVAPAWRGRGVGEAIVRLLLDHLAVRHARRIYLMTRDAQPFYARLGFGERDSMESRQRRFTPTDMILLRAC